VQFASAINSATKSYLEITDIMCLVCDWVTHCVCPWWRNQLAPLNWKSVSR